MQNTCYTRSRAILNSLGGDVVDVEEPVWRGDPLPDRVRGIHTDGKTGQAFDHREVIITGANMVLIDFHPHPDLALCDGPMALTLDEMQHYVADARLVRSAYEDRLKLRERMGR